MGCGVLLGVTCGDCAVFTELAGGPQQTAGHEVKIAGIFHRGIVVSDGRRKHARFALVKVRPRDNGLDGVRRFHFRAVRFFLLPLHGLRAFRQLLAGGDLDIVIQLLFHGRPIIQALRNRAFLRSVTNRDGLLRAVTARLEAEIVEPQRLGRARSLRLIRVAHAITVHRAVQVHAWDAVHVRLQDGFDDFDVFNIGCAFVMYHHVPFCAVFRVRQNTKRQRRSSRIVGMDLCNLRINALFDAFLQNVLLLTVIMAATASDEQNLQRFCLLGEQGGGQGECSEKCDGCFHGESAWVK